MATNYKVGDKIVLFKRHQEAIIRYVGKTEFAPTLKNYGLELLDNGIGDNNGTVNNIKYFKCPKDKGLFILEKDIKFKIQPKRKSVKRNSKVLSARQKSQKKIVTTNTTNITKPSSKKKKKNIKKQHKKKKDEEFKKHLRRKTGPRDVGRNNNYKGIEDVAKKKKKSKKKTKTKKKSAKKSKNVIKSEKNHDEKQIEPNIIETDVSDSDSYKSGYSGSSGFSGYRYDENDDELNDEIENDDHDHRYSPTKTKTESESESESEDSEDDTLTKKVMLMMKQKEEERERKQRMAAEHDKIGIVAMSHKQMNEGENLQSSFLVEDDDKKTEDMVDEGDDIVEAMNDEEKVIINDVDDDLPEADPDININVSEVKKYTFRTYAKRKNSAHDIGATNDGIDHDDVDDDIIVTKNGILEDNPNGIDIKYRNEEKGNGKTKNVNDTTVAQKGCCVVL